MPGSREQPASSKASAGSQEPALESGVARSGLHLYTASAPSGQRVTVLLEELELPFELHPVDLQKGEHLQPSFAEDLSPAQLIPVLVDHDVPGGLRIHESGAIMMYLLECKAPQGKGAGPTRAAELLPPPSDAARRGPVLAWMFWQHSTYYAAARRFFAPLVRGAPSTPETQRYAGEALAEQLRVLERQLEKTGEYMAGDFFSVADISGLPYVLGAVVALGIELARDMPAVHEWVERCLARPAVRRGLRLPAPHPWMSPGPEADAAVEGLRAKLAEMGVKSKAASRVLVEE